MALLQLKGQTLSEILLKSASARRTEVEGLLTTTYGLVAALFPTAADALTEKSDITTATLLLLIGGGGVTNADTFTLVRTICRGIHFGRAIYNLHLTDIQPT